MSAQCPACPLEVPADRLADHLRWVHPAPAVCACGCGRRLTLSPHGVPGKFASKTCQKANRRARDMAAAALREYAAQVRGEGAP